MDVSVSRGRLAASGDATGYGGEGGRASWKMNTNRNHYTKRLRNVFETARTGLHKVESAGRWFFLV